MVVDSGFHPTEKESEDRGECVILDERILLHFPFPVGVGSILRVKGHYILCDLICIHYTFLIYLLST